MSLLLQQDIQLEGEMERLCCACHQIQILQTLLTLSPEPSKLNLASVAHPFAGAPH
jgi:hypothetical protein